MAKSLLSRALDIFTLILIVLIIVPSTRMYLKTQVTRLTMRPPAVISNAESITLQNTDYLLSMIDEKGNTIRLDQFKGQVIFLNFWATWCPPCVAEMPDLQELYDQYKNKVTFIFISNEKRSVIDNFMHKHKFNLPVYQLSGNEIPEVFYSKTIPATFVISQNGQIIVSRKGAAKWNSDSFTRILDAISEN